MEYFNLFLGIALLAVFTWLFIRNRMRRGFMHAVFQIDTIAGISAGIYLIIAFFTS